VERAHHDEVERVAKLGPALRLSLIHSHPRAPAY